MRIGIAQVQIYSLNTSCIFISSDRFVHIKILDDDGIAAPGEVIRPGDIYINKESPIITRGPMVSPAGLPDRLVIHFWAKVLARFLLASGCLLLF